MGIPTKGSRRIQYNSKTFRYLVREVGVTAPGTSHKELIQVTIQEESEAPGRVLQTRFYYGIAITPKLVRQIICDGLKLGWKPSEPGGSFKISVSYGYVKEENEKSTS